MNSTFQELFELRRLGLSLSDALTRPSGDSASTQRTLNSPLVQSLMSTALGGSVGSLSQLLNLVNGSERMKKYAGLLGNLTSCVQVDRIRFYPSEKNKAYQEDLQREFTASRSQGLAGKSLLKIARELYVGDAKSEERFCFKNPPSLLAAINFKNLDKSSAVLPKHVSYTLRMGGKLHASTKELFER